jgi:serine/threonine protein kinase
MGGCMSKPNAPADAEESPPAPVDPALVTLPAASSAPAALPLHPSHARSPSLLSATAAQSSSWSCICRSGTNDSPPNPTLIDLTHFEQLKVVGKGGFGKVHACTRKIDGSLLALKRMSKSEIIRKESHIRMVWTERNIMSRLVSGPSTSPFLVRLEHAFQSSRELFFVMEFMPGGDLRFHLQKRGLMTESEGRFYAAEMVLALESMHRLKLVYRDCKPDVSLGRSGACNCAS